LTVIPAQAGIQQPAWIAHEKAIKEWRRAWKLELIEAANPGWRDLYGDLV
jgi:predicted GIY-YIG superfamily endonuclease